MSGTIVTVSSLKRLDLSNGQALRRPVYLNSWTTIRIGIHYCVPSAATLVGTPGIYVGIGSGLTNGIGDATTTNWIGIKTVSATWTRVLSGAQAYAQIGNTQVAKKIASTLTVNPSGFQGTTVHTSLDAAFRTVLLVEITKGSPNYTVISGAPTSNSGVIAVDVTPAHMDSYMSLPIGLGGIGAVANANITALVGQSTQAMSEAAGNLDCIQIFWDKTAAPLELEGVYHRKLA